MRDLCPSPQPSYDTRQSLKSNDGGSSRLHERSRIGFPVFCSASSLLRSSTEAKCLWSSGKSCSRVSSTLFRGHPNFSVNKQSCDSFLRTETQVFRPPTVVRTVVSDGMREDFCLNRGRLEKEHHRRERSVSS